MAVITWDVSHVLRHDTSTQWASSNIILKDGEPGIETDTQLMKIGNGVNLWKDLKYINKPIFNIEYNFNHSTANKTKIMTIPKDRILKNIIIKFNEAFDSGVNIGISNSDSSVYYISFNDTTPQEISINNIDLNLTNSVDLDLYFSITGTATKGSGTIIGYLS